MNGHSNTNNSHSNGIVRNGIGSPINSNNKGHNNGNNVAVNENSMNGLTGVNGDNGLNVSSNKALNNVSIKDNLRVYGVTVFRPIIYGNVSYRLERPPSKNQTVSSRLLQDDNQDWFRWTVYVRGIENEDLSYFIKKVVFYLHDSYNEPIRVIENSPFELTEEGMLYYNHVGLLQSCWSATQ